MASKRTPAPADQLSLLLLEQNYRRRPHDYFGWMLDTILSGMPLSESDVPKEEQARMTDILAAYEQAVKTELPFTRLREEPHLNDLVAQPPLGEAAEFGRGLDSADAAGGLVIIIQSCTLFQYASSSGL